MKHVDSTEWQVFMDGIRYRYEPVVVWRKSRKSPFRKSRIY